MNVTIFLGNFTYPGGEDLDGFSYLTAFVPRQIPDMKDAKIIESSGTAAQVLTFVIGSVSFVISLVFASSMN